LHNLLGDNRRPLVLAGVDYLFPIYKEASTYTHLMDEGIAGNPEQLSAEDLHKQAWVILQPYFGKTKADAITQYGQSLNDKRASNDINEIVPAAYYGKVELLFVASDFQYWGVFNPATNVVITHQKQGLDDEDDLLDFAAIQTFIHGGIIYTVKMESVPGKPPLAAVFRY